MDGKERRQIKEKIQSEIDAVQKDILSLQERTQPVAPDNAIGRLSRMDAINSKSINDAALSKAKQKLTKLKYALAKVEHPDFGICVDCGDPIPLGRILAVPESNLCVECAD